MTRKILYVVAAAWVLAFIWQTCAHAQYSLNQGGSIRYHDNRGTFVGTSDGDPNEGPTRFYDPQGNLVGTSTVQKNGVQTILITFYEPDGRERARVKWPASFSLWHCFGSSLL